jgi:hypothetical protein
VAQHGRHFTSPGTVGHDPDQGHRPECCWLPMYRDTGQDTARYERPDLAWFPGGVTGLFSLGQPSRVWASVSCSEERRSRVVPLGSECILVS